MDMRQRGNGKNGKIEQGDRVRLGDGVTGTVESFTGGTHQNVTVRSESGYTYTGPTHEAEKLDRG